ncbi:hypothetical protein LEP1GSC034_3707 [Leptospira interrogans str. 2003000735]|uniref:Uncharacterized protein n=7 Tax=Leptospira interrogans TaxID=173 RepID=A0A0E2D2K4_LEPIR|nr:hypothetical protein LEP1GSC007_3407 [Leptospira interrogans serovar Bulgarica str. Mallika]EKN88159.1 hypothetical protein LEP1GSC027_4721 [Leptospira interrogans str. 2002000624]EKO08817.1 hypothetical protein LEP1GSC077_3675 [Leptospira interrogans str. C10069]EKO86683.1 hypothetical protein LEP1GSC009_3632 [Leptospira interrogans serovar Grippotyphosa str. Andaman]EKP22686.1 hypothetical protein LEP1GSC117_1841 [Leptospira interrogans serovar Icterohaemorrhagiae str. Verdun LP]EKP77507.
MKSSSVKSQFVRVPTWIKKRISGTDDSRELRSITGDLHFSPPIRSDFMV